MKLKRLPEAPVRLALLRGPGAPRSTPTILSLRPPRGRLALKEAPARKNRRRVSGAFGDPRA